VGFSNYSSLSDSPAFLKQITYLAAVNYGTYNALKPVEGNNVHPIYQGKPVAVCDAVKEIQPSRIFINLGINELAGSNAIQRTIYNYCQLVYNLKLSSPDSKIYVVSLSPMTKSHETSTFNNDTIKEFNKNLQKFAEPWGVTYVDLASILTNEQGALPESYSTDGYVHLTNTVYSYWGNYFKKYATEHINDGLKK
jgi:lysophospholipase L1-like esterase